MLDLEFDNVVKARTRELLMTNTYEELMEMILNSPKVKSPVMGYTTEGLFESRMIRPNPAFTNVVKPSDDGPDSKVDLFFDYNGRRYRAQVKSIYTNTLSHNLDNGTYTGTVGITNNSKEYIFDDNVKFKTKCPTRLDYDVLVASMYLVTGNMDDFLFMPSYYLGYPTAQSQVPAQYRHYFAGSGEHFTWPVVVGSRWTTDLTSILDNRLGMPVC